MPLPLTAAATQQLRTEELTPERVADILLQDDVRAV